MAIIAADGFKISKTNTPTREGERIATIAEITDREKVPNPSVGMLVFVEDEQAHYTVLELGPAKIGGIEVPNVVVSKYIKTLGEQAVDTNKLADESVTKEKLSSDLKLSISKLEQTVFPLEVTLSVSPPEAQRFTGASKDFTISWTVEIAGEAVTPSNIVLKVGGETVPVDKEDTSKIVSATDDKKVELTIEADGRTATKTTKLNFAYPAYTGIVANDFIVNETNVTSLKEMPLVDGKARTYTYDKALDREKIVYAYAKSYGTLTGIIEGGSNNLINNYTRSEITINGIDYYVYITTNYFSTEQAPTYQYK